MKRNYYLMLTALVFLLLGCREELDYFNEKQSQASYDFSMKNVTTNILQKKDYEAKPFLKPSVDFVNAYLKSQHSGPVSSSSKITAADITGIDLYTDIVEEVKYGNADYYSFYVRGKDENDFEQKLVVKAVNDQVVDKYLLRYKRIDGFKIDPSSYQTVKWVADNTNGESLLSAQHTVMIDCTVYTTISYDCGEGGHHVGMVCPTSHEYVPMPILYSYVDLNCMNGDLSGGSAPGNSGPGSGSSPGSNGGSGNVPDVLADNQPVPTPPLITMPTSAPLYDIKGKITGGIKNPPDFNPLDLSSSQITVINSKYDVRLEIYKYLALNSSYPFNQGTTILPEFINYVKFILQYFTNHPNNTWLDFHTTYLLTPCEKIKELMENAKFAEKFNEMTQSAVFNLKHEKAYAVKFPAAGSANTEPQYINADLPDCAGEGSNSIIDNPLVYGLMHDHQNQGCAVNGNPPGIPVKAPSPIDIKTFFNDLLPHSLANTGSYGNAYSLVTTSGGNYMLMYYGNIYPSKIETAEFVRLNIEYSKEFTKLYEDNYTINQTDIEQTFLTFIKDKLNRPGLQIYKVTQNSATKIEYNTSFPNNIKPTPCP